MKKLVAHFEIEVDRKEVGAIVADHNEDIEKDHRFKPQDVLAEMTPETYMTFVTGSDDPEDAQSLEAFVTWILSDVL